MCVHIKTMAPKSASKKRSPKASKVQKRTSPKRTSPKRTQKGGDCGCSSAPAIMSGGGKKAKRSNSPKRGSKQRQASPKQTQKQKGGAYFLNVQAPRIGGLSEVTPVPPPEFMAQKGGFSDGLPSIFSGDMMVRDFSCHAPTWTPKCI